MNTKILAIIALAVVVSGCSGGGDDSEKNAADQSLSCSRMSLDVAFANGEEAKVVNTGESTFGNVTVTWNYQNSGKITKEFEAPPGNGRSTYESGSSGPIKQVLVQHTECPSRAASFY